MKITNFKISQIIILFICCFQPMISFKIRLMGHNSYENKSKSPDFYNESMKNSNLESPQILQSAGDWDSQDDMEMSNLEIRHQIYNHNTEPLYRTDDSDNNNNNNNNNNSSSDSSNSPKYANAVDNSPKFISRMINSPSHPPHMALNNCPCAALVKCQPCGLAPMLDFQQRNRFECHCAPKPNCPACPPLSLIHEIAAKKVLIFLNRLNKINNLLQI